MSEVSSYFFLYYMTRLHPRASTYVFLLPFAILRFALMVGNWGQHALVDEVDPSSDFRTSITMIDVMVRLTNKSYILKSVLMRSNRAIVFVSTMGIIRHTTSIPCVTGVSSLYTSFARKKPIRPEEHLSFTISIGS